MSVLPAQVILSDNQVYASGPYLTYLSPWNKGRLVQGIDYTESLTLTPASFPNGVVISWNWPATPSPTVYNFNYVDFGDYQDATVPTPITPAKVKDIAVLTEHHALSLAGPLDDFDVIDDMFLTAAPGSTTTHKAELEVFLHTNTSSFDYVTRTAQPVGTFVDAQGRAWTVALDSGNGNDVLFMPSDRADVASGSVDIKAMMDYLVANGVLTGDEYFNGMGLGAETKKGSGSLTVQSFSVDYQAGAAQVQTTGAGQTSTTTAGPGGTQLGSDPLVDPTYYLAAYPDVAAAGVDPARHYDTFGWREGRNPDALFSTAGYLGAYPDVAAAGTNPLQSYEQIGWQQGRDSSAAFSTALYLLHNPDVAAAGVDPLQHFLRYGQAEGRAAPPAVGHADEIGAFDPHFYLLANPDVAKAADATANPDAFALQHYDTYGWHEGRDPNAYFSTAAYLAQNPDVAAAGVNPLTHYELFGWHEGRNPSAAFNTAAYLTQNPDVQAAGVDPLQHFLTFGAWEGRNA